MTVRQSAQKRRQQTRVTESQGPALIHAKNPKQATYLSALDRFDTVIAVGPAGTGKTYVACAQAASLLHRRKVQKIILARPLVGLDSKTMGFLPGNVAKKMEPWARPLVEAFKATMGTKRYEEAVTAGTIEVVALEHVRGLTFDSAAMILDEAQNTTPREMKAFLTRIGEDSRLVLCGDVSQSDLLDRSANGLSWALKAADTGLVPDVGVVEFTHADTVRSKRCAQWAAAFDALEAQSAVLPFAVRG
jgi:phosphate starvation-inducible PhoH-like protein